jgi:hypothetical protein
MCMCMDVRCACMCTLAGCAGIAVTRERQMARAVAEAAGLHTRAEIVQCQLDGKGKFTTVTMELANETLVRRAPGRFFVCTVIEAPR